MEERDIEPLAPDERRRIIEGITAYCNGAKPSVAGEKEGEALYSDGFESFEGFERVGTAQLLNFNTELLPQNVRNFTNAVTDSLQVDSGMVAPAMMAAGALGIQKKFCAHPPPDWYEPGNLYIVIVADSSERKSPTMKEIMKPIYEYEKAENERRAPEIATYETKKKILQNQIDNITKAASKPNKKGKKDTEQKYLDLGDLVTLQQELSELEECAPLKLTVDDVTMEVLGRVMGQNEERIGIFSTEGGIFNILAGRYSDKTVIDLVLKGYSGDRYALDRVTRKGQVLEHPLITMLLFIQPVVLKDVMENDEFVGRGLNARFLYSIPQSMIGMRKYRVKKISEFDMEDYGEAIRRLFAIPVPETPKVVELSEEADKMAEDFFYELEEKMQSATPEFKTWLGKLHGTTIRIALVYHCFEWLEDSAENKISGETMKAAIETGRYYQAHAEAAFNLMGLMEPPEVRDAKYIMSRIDSTGQTEIRLRDLHQICKDRKGMETKEGMIPGLNCLIKHGYIRIQKKSVAAQNPQNAQKGGRPSEIVHVNPEYIKYKEEQKNERSI